MEQTLQQETTDQVQDQEELQKSKEIQIQKLRQNIEEAFRVLDGNQNKDQLSKRDDNNEQIQEQDNIQSKQEITEKIEQEQEPEEYQVGQKIMALLSNQQHYMAEIVQKKAIDLKEITKLRQNHKSMQKYKYYIHFDGMDKRLDKWCFDYELIDPRRQIEEQKFSGLNSDQNQLENSSSAKALQIQKRVTRHAQRKQDEINPTNQEFHDTNPEIKELEKKHQETTKIRNIEKIYFGDYEINTWYFSPYPEEYGEQSILYICEYCLKYMRKQKTINAHKGKCQFKTPSGKVIYQDKKVKELFNKLEGPEKKQTQDEKQNLSSISIYQIDGVEHKLYCQNLCLLAKLFLDHKTLYYDVSPFLFYVMTEDSKDGSSHIVGYFSKEKTMSNDYNLACIMVLPPYQRRGYGKFLISLSYQLSIDDGRICTPERPLSDMGKVSYKSFWTDTLLEALLKTKGNISIKELSEFSYIKVEDIIQTLSSLNLVRYWKGQYVITNFNVKIIEEHFKKKDDQCLKYPRKPIKFKPQLLIK
eukprot:403367456